VTEVVEVSPRGGYRPVACLVTTGVTLVFTSMRVM